MPVDRPSFVQFYPSDWKGGTAGLPLSVEWTYLQICLHNWDKGEALPASQARLAFARNPAWEDDLQLLIDAGKVFRTAGGGLFVKRALAEASRAQAAYEKKSKAGKSGAKKRWENNDMDGNAMAMPCETDGNPNSNQNQNQNQNDPNGSYPPTPLAGDLVFSVPPDVWRAFRDHRTKLRAPLTAHAEKLILRKLEDLHRRGHDPTAVLEQSITAGWKGVFELKGNHNGNRDRNASGNGFLAACAQ